MAAQLQAFRDEFNRLQSDYNLIKIIGSGGNGIVFAAQHSRTHQTVAIKKLSQVLAMPEVGRRALREIKLLRHFQGHVHIVPLLEVLRPPSMYFDDVYLVQQHMPSDLNRILRSGQALTEDHFQYFLYQLLKGLKYIHSAGVLHRDLKPSNLLINEDCDLMICDFGMARGLDETASHANFMTEYVATRWYRAPEIMFSFDVYTKAVDIWSAGCIFAEMFWRKPLFPGKDYIHQLKLILAVRGTPPLEYLDRIGSAQTKKFMKSLPHLNKTPLDQLFSDASPLALDLIDKMLAWRPQDRITAEEALSHPYLAAYHNPADEPTCPSFDHSFESRTETIESLRELIFVEMQSSQDMSSQTAQPPVPTDSHIWNQPREMTNQSVDSHATPDSFVTEFNIDTPDLNASYNKNSTPLSMDFDLSNVDPLGFSSTSYIDNLSMDLDLSSYLEQAGNIQELERQLEHGLMSD